jgi:DNA processing protein
MPSRVVDQEIIQFHRNELEIVAVLMNQTGFGEAAFWRLYCFLRKQNICFNEFWSASNISFFPIQNNIAETIKKAQKEYKSGDYFEWLAEQQVSVYFYTDDDYPPLLRTIDIPPPLLYGRGRPIRTKHSLAVIGSRQMTMYGKLVITHWLPDLINAEIPIISGAVRGVDRTVQQLALDSGGKTIAVLGHGLLGSVGTSQQQLLANWEAAGAWLVSSFAPKADPSKGTFLARNRVVAGMSKAVLVIEAALKSGTMHTASWTAEFGRQLLAVPGSVFNQFSDGTAALLNQGASLVTSAEEVLAILNDDSTKSELTTATSQPELYSEKWSAAEQAVWDIVRAGETQFYLLTAKLVPRFSLSEVLVAITSLELQNYVVQKHGWLLAGKLHNK